MINQFHHHTYFKIDDIEVNTDIILAPMDGYSDMPFRLITREFGMSLSYTEFINALDVINGHPYLVDERTKYKEDERPIGFQIFDNEPERLLHASMSLREMGPDFIDVNLGCSAKQVSNRGAGAALLKEPEKISRIFKSLTSHLDIPVTAKIRLGWDEESKNYLDIARCIQDNGGACVTVHGRTRMGTFKEPASWDEIREVKAVVDIPVIGNGDILTPKDAYDMKQQTGCDAVMVGRGAIGNPWIFASIDRGNVAKSEVRRVMIKHLKMMADFYGEERGTILFRKHALQYLKPYEIKKDDRLKLLSCETMNRFITMLDIIVFFDL